MCGMSVEDHAISELLPQHLPETVAQDVDPFHRREITRKPAGFAETDCKQRALRTCSPSGLVPGAMDQRFERYAAAYKQGTDAFGRIELVARKRQQIDAEIIDAGRNLADRLSGVGVEQDAVLVGNSGTLRNRLDRADLVVGVHDADDDRAGRESVLKAAGVDPACAVNGQVGHLRAHPFEKLARFDDRRMLDAAGDDVTPLVAKCKGRAFEGKIVRFASAAREHDFVVVAAEQNGYLTARRLKSCLRRGRSPMPTRRISIMILKKRPHRQGNRAIDRRTGIVVEIDALHRQNTKTLSASVVIVASSSIVLRCAPAIRAASSRPRASMQAPHRSNFPLALSTRFSIRSTL